MYVGIDIGGTKTLVAVFDKAGQRRAEKRFETPKKYAAWLDEFAKILSEVRQRHHVAAVCCAVPGLIDRQNGLAIQFGTLDWHDLPIVHDLEELIPHCRVFIENDAKLAGLSEAILVHKKYKKVLYLTISTGIGAGLIIDGKIDADFDDIEPGHMILEHDGQLKKWQDIVSGRAIVERFGQRAAEIDDKNTWRQISLDIALGLNELIATLNPDVVIIGGGVGSHFDKFGAILNEELTKLADDVIKLPPVIAAQRPEDAVIYGCYELIRQKF